MHPWACAGACAGARAGANASACAASRLALLPQCSAGLRRGLTVWCLPPRSHVCSRCVTPGAGCGCPSHVAAGPQQPRDGRRPARAYWRGGVRQRPLLVSVQPRHWRPGSCQLHTRARAVCCGTRTLSWRLAVAHNACSWCAVTVRAPRGLRDVVRRECDGASAAVHGAPELHQRLPFHHPVQDRQGVRGRAATAASPASASAARDHVVHVHVHVPSVREVRVGTRLPFRLRRVVTRCIISRVVHYGEAQWCLEQLCRCSCWRALATL